MRQTKVVALQQTPWAQKSGRASAVCRTTRDRTGLTQHCGLLGLLPTNAMVFTASTEVLSTWTKSLALIGTASSNKPWAGSKMIRGGFDKET